MVEFLMVVPRYVPFVMFIISLVQIALLILLLADIIRWNREMKKRERWRTPRR